MWKSPDFYCVWSVLAVVLYLVIGARCQSHWSTRSYSPEEKEALNNKIYGSGMVNDMKKIFSGLNFTGVTSLSTNQLFQMFLNQIPHQKNETECLKYYIDLPVMYFVEFYYRQAPITFTWSKTFESIMTMGPSQVYTVPGEDIPRVRLETEGDFATSKTHVTVFGTSVIYEFHHPKVYDAVALSDDTSFQRTWECKLSLQTCKNYYRVFQPMGKMNLQDDWSGDAFRFCERPREAGSCKLNMGDEVKLIYWPPSNTTEGPGNTRPPAEVTLDAVTFGGEGIYLISAASRWISKNQSMTATFGPKTDAITTSSVLTGPFVLRSPTVYLAHHNIHVTEYNDWAKPTKTWFAKSADVVPIHADEVYTIRPDPRTYGNEGASFVERMKRGVFGVSITRSNTFQAYFDLQSMNFQDLVNPVPASAYYNARSEDCWGRQTHCRTITDDTFRPLLAFKRAVWQSILPPAAADCYRFGIVDPPVALTPIPSASLRPISLSKPTNGGSAAGNEAQMMGRDGEAYPGMAPLVGLPQATGPARSGNRFESGSISNPEGAALGLVFGDSDQSLSKSQVLNIGRPPEGGERTFGKVESDIQDNSSDENEDFDNNNDTRGRLSPKPTRAGPATDFLRPNAAASITGWKGMLLGRLVTLGAMLMI